jgi:hypothetical protein
VLVEPATHGFGYNIGSLKGPLPMLSMYTYCANCGNFLASATSWSK